MTHKVEYMFGKKKKESYIRNATSTFYDGNKYDSKKEAGYAQYLDLMIKAGEVKEWSAHYPLKVFIGGKWIFTYKIDFRVVMSDDSVEFHEVKGWWTAYAKLKFKVVEAIFDTTDIEKQIAPMTSIENYEPATLKVVK